jgi:hypothetical protein
MKLEFDVFGVARKLVKYMIHIIFSRDTSLYHELFDSDFEIAILELVCRIMY